MTEDEVRSATGSRRARIDQHSPVEQRAHDLVWAIEKMGAHPLLTSAQSSAQECLRLLAEWHVIGEPGGSPLRYGPALGDDAHERFVPKATPTPEQTT